MRNIYEVLRQKELEVSRLEKEVEALRVVAPLLSEDGEAENDNQPTLERAENDTPVTRTQWLARQSQKAFLALSWTRIHLVA
jgi:asparagine synthetase A